MIEINCSIAVNQTVKYDALCKLIEAYAILGWPIVITDRWLRDGQPIPHDLVHRTIWDYQRGHPHLPAGITFSVSSNPGFDTMMNHLVPGGVPRIDSKYTQEKFSLKQRHVAPSKGTQAQEFRKMRCYDAFFNVKYWYWSYNTVQRLD